jgi:hypothetical protein
VCVCVCVCVCVLGIFEIGSFEIFVQAGHDPPDLCLPSI